MPAPSRDRLARPVDISALYGGVARRVGLIVDQPGLIWGGLSGNVPRNVPGSGRGGRGRRTGTRGRRGSILPSWWPRRPLSDITWIVRAIERRRAELNQTREASPEESNVEAEAAANNELEEFVGSETPLPTISMQPQPSPATLVLRINGDNNQTDSDFITPQERLLLSIEEAIERRRAELNQTREASPEESKVEAEAAPNNELEEIVGSQTPLPTVSVQPRSSPATQVLTINADNNQTDSDFMTPQRRLLLSIEEVSEAWLEEREI